MHALSVENLAKHYGPTVALRGVNLTVEPGQLVGLIGPNGAGKSTLVKIGCGLVRPTGGRVEVCGAPAGSTPARAALGYLAELFRFPPWLSAREVLELHQHLAESDGGTSECEDLLQLVGLERVGDRRVGAMSKGMQQRLGIAQALVGSPRLLLLDEPTSALDPAGRRDVRVLLEEVRARGIAVLLNSHLLTEVELVCDQVVILKDGDVIAEGNPAQMGSPSGIEVETDGGLKRWPDATRSDVPGLVAELVAQGAQIYSVRPVKRSLEEIYMEIVGGEIS